MNPAALLLPLLITLAGTTLAALFWLSPLRGRLTITQLAWLLSLAPLAAFLVLLSFLPAISKGQALTWSFEWIPALGLSAGLYFDSLSALFALVVAGIGTVVVIYAGYYFKESGTWAVNIGLLVGGLVMLVLGSNWLVNSASSLARAFGVSELVIGLTIVAIGTSAPELATSLMAAKRGERDIAVGNAIGSNLFNILGVLGITAALAPNGIAVPRSAMAFDIPVMIAVAIAALPVFFTGYSISRLEGAIFLLYYVAYALFLLLDAVEHDLLPLYSTIMFVFVIPITVLTLAILVAREVRLHRRGGSLLKPETVPVADNLRPNSR